MLTHAHFAEQYALTEASYTIVRMLQEFSEIESMDHQERVTKGLGLTLTPGNGVKVKLRKRVWNA